MKGNKKTLKDFALVLVMAGGLVSPPPAAAQHEGGGLLGRGQNDREAPGEVHGSGLLNQGFGSSGSTLFNQGFGGTQGGLGNQGFGGTQGGLGNQNFGGNQGGITNQGFQVPIGSGLLVLAAAGAGYATIKKRNKKQNKQIHQNNK